ncbi:MAG: hypothetical protein ACLRTQ_04790 [Candidatus Borkfalkia sp.]
MDPFTFSGGYNVGGELVEGDMLDDDTCTYKQAVDIKRRAYDRSHVVGGRRVYQILARNDRK